LSAPVLSLANVDELPGDTSSPLLDFRFHINRIVANMTRIATAAASSTMVLTTLFLPEERRGEKIEQKKKLKRYRVPTRPSATEQLYLFTVSERGEKNGRPSKSSLADGCQY
jgi:hypothetical protein